jgi:RNA polymerase sigma factor (sigma-70 family)
MKNNTGDEPPAPTDLDGWRSAIADERLAGFRMEAVIAAIQDLGPRCDPLVLNPLILHVSDVITKILRRSVGHNFRNQGEDIITEVHGKLVSAMHDPTSKDGDGLREAFVFRVEKRAIDEIRRERKREARETAGQIEDDKLPAPESQQTDPRQELQESIDVKRILGRIPDERKRRVFELHMDRIPLQSKRGQSIAHEVGVSAKTAGQWIDEILEQLKSDPEAQRLLNARRAGAQS